MSPALLLPPTAAFVAGIVTSLHCAGMCGPLACATLPAAADRNLTIASSYQVARIASYACLGAVAGGLGRLPLSWLPSGVLHFAPFVIVIFFLGLALGWDRHWAKPFGLARRVFPRATRLARRSPMAAAALVGAMTPLLPCGPLYFFFGVALLAGSGVRGAELMLAFGLGTLPLLWLVQTQFGRIQARLPPRWLGRIRVGLALLAAGLAAWRAGMGLYGEENRWICF